MIKPYYEEPGITIYHGDCREILPHLPKVDLVLTDPPYGVGKDEWDVSSCEWVLRYLKAKSILITPGIKNLFSYPRPTWIASYCYPNGEKRSVGGGINNWEPVLIYGENQFGLDCRLFKPRASIKIHGHSTPKPVSPWEWLVLESSKEGDTILDPFMGSGTTLVAAKQLGRKAIGIEIEQKYCDIAIDRLRQEVFNFD